MDMLQREVVRFESECVWREDYPNEGVSGDGYEQRDACVLDLVPNPVLDHDHFDGARDFHGALRGF